MQPTLYKRPYIRLLWQGMAALIIFMMMGIFPAVAKEKKQIVLLESMPVPVVLEHSKWVLDELANLGYIPGNTIDLIRYNVDGDREKATAFMSKILSQGKPDLVLTNATLASQEAMPFLKKRNIPQLFFTVADPIGSGLISRTNEPTGGNLTGRIYSLDPRAKIKNMLRLVEQLPLKTPIRFGIIHTSYPSAVGEVKNLIQASKKIKEIVFVTHKIQYCKVPEGVPAMLEQVKEGIGQLEKSVDFWWEVPGPLGELHEYDQLFHDLSQHPVGFCNTLDGVKLRGSLLYMSPDAEKYGRETAAVAHAILSGTDPGTIPVTTPATFLLAVNLKTALKLNIVIPSDMFDLAGRHVY